MLRLSLHRHVPSLVTAGTLLMGCGRSLLDDTDTDASSGGEGTPQPTEATDPSNPSDPSAATITATDPTDPTGSSHPGPPQLIAATLRDPSSLELFFSEPIASSGGIDPSKFRLSASFANSAYNYGTFYADIGRWNGVEQCYENCYGAEENQYCNEWCYTPAGPPVHVVGVADTAYADRLLLTVDLPIGASVCKQLQQRLDQGADAAAIFLHYSNNGQGVTDLDGEQLEALSEAWVLLGTQEYTYVPGFFPVMDPFIPIDCPFV